ncbi:endonuclease/exonuclease/phosphatase family protein [Flavobacterium sp.]|uniref:endonuclease/exonuclease/phosphatase family protein n=1 Tax=Flavobacterium sp. TaxID=239 RepID=UPI002CB4193C|nr:endonuclease/exonuclease/phosphatase family protein [Flavobacterium sp.]HSD06921.1 endonuclease/exonuclease/phosphatase family protein [Flavobacterium sp.]
MTYNIRLDIASDGENDWTHRKDFFNAQIQFYAPDIFGVQEAKPNQVLDISTALPKYGYVGIGREGVGKGEASNIFYDKEKFKVIKSNTFWLSETPDSISIGWDAAYNRICTYALLQNKQNNKLIWVFNTHLDHVGEQARTKGLELILSRIEKLNSNKYPVILMGDFNSEPTTDRIVSLKNKMNDARTISKEKPFGPYGTFNNFKYNEPTTLLIDYIFLSINKTITVNKYAVLSDAKDLKYPSDHFPVFVEVNYK